MGWWQLADIAREHARWVEDEEARPPVACPNDGTPLEQGPGGILFCRFDGWRWEGTAPDTPGG